MCELQVALQVLQELLRVVHHLLSALPAAILALRNVANSLVAARKGWLPWLGGLAAVATMLLPFNWAVGAKENDTIDEGPAQDILVLHTSRSNPFMKPPRSLYILHP